MTKLRITLLAAMILLTASQTFGVQSPPALIFDMPADQIARQFDVDPASLLTAEQMEQLRTSRYDGDTFKVLIILVDWFNRPATYPVETFDSMMFSRNVWPDGSVADYFWECSYGGLTMIGDCYGWHDAGMYDSDFWFGYLVDDLDPVIDYSDYDSNNDGFVDAILFIRSGNGEEDSGDPDDIWSYAVSYSGDGVSTGDGVNINRWCTVPETWPLRDPADPTQFSGVDTLNRIRVACHELTHNLGMPDLYDYDSKLDTMTYITPGDENDHPLVDWCVMGYGGYGIMAIGSTIPSHHCGWMKNQLGWIEPIEITGTIENLVIYDIETHADSSLYLLPIDASEGEYFLLEYRNPHANCMFDKIDSDFSCYKFPDLTYGGDPLDRGLLITHAHDSLPDGWYRMNNGTPEYDHYTVIVKDAGYNPDHDYIYNPEGRLSDSAQWWYPYETRRAAPFSNDVPGQEEFGPATTPSSDGYGGPTGIVVRVDSIVDDRLYAYVSVPGPDLDEDGVTDAEDNCPSVYNPQQEDDDTDEYGNVCDNCPSIANADQTDSDGDDTGDVCDDCTDLDDDGYGDPGYTANTCADDNCPTISNPDQSDLDGDGLGDVCDSYCCGLRADVNHDGIGPDISDLVYLVVYMFQEGPVAPCEGETDINGNDLGPDIEDLVHLVTYMFQEGPPVEPCP